MCYDKPTRIAPGVLLDAMQGETDAIAYYQQLSEMAPDPEDARRILDMRSDELGHRSALADLYRWLTGSNAPALQPRTAAISSYAEGVKESILHELEDSEAYRCIYLDCENPARRLFFDMMSDENKHAAILNYLYIKSIERCCDGAPEPVTCEGIAHTVQPGDSLWLIGQNYAVTVEELLAANPQITDPGNIYTGQIICVPCAGRSYTVQPGDSLWAIAQKNGTTVEDLVAANPLVTDAGLIDVGQVLCIPCCGGGSTPEPEPQPQPTRESLVYLYGGTAAYYLEALAQTQGSICTACPDFFNLDENGNLLLAAANKLNTEFVQELHRQGIRVTPFISNHWNRELGAAAISNRDQLTNQLAAVVEQYNLDGVNFDIENMTEQYRDAYVDLARLMGQKLPEGKTVSVAVAANPNGWNTGWHGSYDYPGLAEQCDYLVIMGYDESYQGGPEGPVASSGFFERSIQYALEQGVPREKIVMAVPFFGRYWKIGSASGGIGIADRDVDYLLANYTGTAFYDEERQSAYATITILPEDPKPQIWGGRVLGEGTYHIWYDSLDATRYKLEMINSYDLLGAGAWALGQESPGVWDFYTQALNS